MATTDVEAPLAADPRVEECTVFGVEVPGTGGRMITGGEMPSARTFTSISP